MRGGGTHDRLRRQAFHARNELGVVVIGQVVQSELRDGPRRRRVGIALDSRMPAREGAEIRSSDGTPIGKVSRQKTL